MYGARGVDSVLTMCCILLTCEERCTGRGASQEQAEVKGDSKCMTIAVFTCAARRHSPQAVLTDLSD